MTASIVVPVYNAKETLCHCLSSIAAQTHTDLEVLLVDDGSTDGSGALCDHWAGQDPRFRVIHQQNRGPGAARNAGLEKATGEYLFFVDSDDTVDAALVEKALGCFWDTGAQVVLYGCCHVYPTGKTVNRPLAAPKAVYKDQALRETLLPGLFTYAFGTGISSWSKGYELAFIRRHNLRFPEEREIACEDGIFQLELFSKASCAALLPSCLYQYHRTAQSLSRAFFRERQQQNNAFLGRAEAVIRTEQLPQKTLLHVRSRYHGLTLGTMTALLRRKGGQAEKRQLLTALFHDPVLVQTLEEDVLALDAALPRQFWRCLRGKRYGLCHLLLLLNHLRQAMEERP